MEINKEITIEPWKPQDKGHICLPLKRNIPEGHKDWKMVKCPICNSECWESDLARQVIGHGNMIGVCTECAIKTVVNNGQKLKE